jgi:hypothetical protein
MNTSNRVMRSFAEDQYGKSVTLCGELASKPIGAKTLPLDGKENLVIDGDTYEAFNTSGGVGTMCETYSGSIGLTGREVFDISGITAGVASGFAQSRRLAVRARRADGSATDFEVSARIETPQEVLYVRHGRILQYVLRQLLGARSEHVPTPARNRIRFLPPIMTGRWTKALSSPSRQAIQPPTLGARECNAAADVAPGPEGARSSPFSKAPTACRALTQRDSPNGRGDVTPPVLGPKSPWSPATCAMEFHLAPVTRGAGPLHV